MTATTSESVVSLAELSLMFTGVPDENDEWSTAPTYSAKLACEIAKRCDAQSAPALRTILYDTTPEKDLPVAAQVAIRRGVKKYLEYRATQTQGRGL